MNNQEKQVNEPLVLSSKAEWGFRIGCLLLTPVMFLVLLETVAFFWERAQASGPYAWELVASRRIDLDVHGGSMGGYTLMSPGHRYRWQDIPVEVNNNGFRGPDFLEEKPEGTYRILNLGDSIAMGWGVTFENTYGHILENALNEQGSKLAHFEVINAGVPGWNLENELAYLSTEGYKLNPDLILLDVTLVNDIFGKNALEENQSPALIEWLRDHTHLWPYLSIQFQWMKARAEGKDRIPVIDPPMNPDKYFPLSTDAQKYTEIINLIERMDQVAGGIQAEFLVIFFPLEHQVINPDFPTTPQDILAGDLADDGIAYLDLLPPYREACLEQSCQMEDRYLFADVWMHPSPFGNQIAAEELARMISEKHLVVEPIAE